MEAAPHPWPALGALLLRDGLVDKDALEEVLQQQRDSSSRRISGKRLGEALVDRGLVTADQVAHLVAEQYELPFVELEESDVNLQVAALLPEEIAQRLEALPVSTLPDDSVLVAVADPTNVLHSDELRRILARPLRFAVSTPDALRSATAHVYGRLRERSASEGAAVVDAPSSDLFYEDEDGAPTGTSRSLVDLVRDASPHPALGTLLMREGLVGEEDLDAALAQQRLTGSKRLGEILVERGVVTRTQVARLVAEQYEMPFLDLGELGVDPSAAALLAEPTARRLRALPVSFTSDGSLIVAVADPTDAFYADDLRLALDVPLRFAVADPDEIEAEIARVNPLATRGDEEAEMDENERLESAGGDAEAVFEQAEVGYASDEPDKPDPLDDAVEEVPLAAVIEAAPEPEAEPEPEPEEDSGPEEELSPSPSMVVDVDTTEIEEAIERALALGATDIHFTPQPHAVVVRIRIDGVLRELDSFPSTRQAEIATGLKLLAELDANGSQAAQEGRFMLDRGEHPTDLRIVVLPTAHGEKATLHLLSEFSQPISLADLGLTAEREEALRNAITQPSGLVLVCGPAGNGCSTTLYAALRELNTAERALATIEDPVEQVIPGVDQVAVDPVAGLTYPEALHAILLSDPDVVAVGELHDSETANAAVRAAVAGRLVLSRLRVPSPAEAVERLVELGVERGPVSATLGCVVAQRLVRRICEDCREPYYASADELGELGRSRDEAGRRLLARGSGCVACAGTGFRGRIAIFEVLSVTDEIRELLARGAATEEIEHAAISNGMQTFREEGIRLCLEGMTTVSELQRVVAGDSGREPTAVPEDPAPSYDEDGASAPA